MPTRRVCPSSARWSDRCRPVDVGAMDPLAQGGRGQVEVCGDPRDAAVCDLAETHGLGLEFRGEGAAWPLLEGLCLLVHGVLRASILANFGVHESEASSHCIIYW